MAFVGFEFDKIEVKRKPATGGKITINTNVNIVDVSKADLKVGKEAENAVKFGFEFKLDYGTLGNVLLGGSVMYLTTKEETTSLVNDWKKKKQLKKELMAALMNRILSKCNIQSIILSDVVNLPPPVRMPRVKTK